MKRNCSQMSEAEGYLYLIFMYSVGNYSHSFHRIKLSDLNLSSEGVTRSHETKDVTELPKPLLELPYESYPGFMSFVYFDGKIYMFGGEHYEPEKRGKLSERCYVFDTHNNPNNVVNNGPSMKKAKYRPIVLGPIGDIFYVLSSNLASRDLEKFEPKSASWDKSWTVLDQFPFAIEGRRPKYEVLSYAIVQNLLIFSTRKGIFTYHVKGNNWTSSRGVKMLGGEKDDLIDVGSSGGEKMKLFGGKKDDWIDMGSSGGEKINTLGAESGEKMKMLGAEKDDWMDMDSLGGKKMKMLPFIDEAKLLDDFWYAFSSPKEFGLEAYHFDVDKRGLQSYDVGSSGGEKMKLFGGKKDDWIDMGSSGGQKMNTLGAESGEKMKMLGAEKDDWMDMDSLGGKKMKMLPFIDEAKLLDDFWYAFSSPKEFGLEAYHFDVDKRGMQSYEVRGLVSPSGIVEHETVNIMVPLKGKKFCIVSSGLCGCGIHFYVTVDMYQLSETTGGSNEKSTYVQVSTKSSATYVKEDYEWTPLTTTCVFVGYASGWVPAHFPPYVVFRFSSHSHSSIADFIHRIWVGDLRRQRSSGGDLRWRYHGGFSNLVFLFLLQSSPVTEAASCSSISSVSAATPPSKLDGRDSELLRLLRGYMVYQLRTGLQLELFSIFNAFIIHRNSPRIPDQRSCSFIY